LRKLTPIENHPPTHAQQKQTSETTKNERKEREEKTHLAALTSVPYLINSFTTLSFPPDETACVESMPSGKELMSFLWKRVYLT
jgi:hypothetical protein